MNSTKSLSLVLAVLTISLAACSSQDKGVYRSTMSNPLTVKLIDPHSDEVLWEKDVPVLHRIVVDFDRPSEAEPFWSHQGVPATRMHWRILSDNDLTWMTKPVDEGQMDLPGTDVLLKQEFRPGPEYPEEAIFGPEPAAEEPAVEEAAAEEPVVEEPAVEEPVVEEPVAKEPAPAPQKPKAQEPMYELPPEQPTPEAPKAEPAPQPKAQPKAEPAPQPEAKQPEVEQPEAKDDIYELPEEQPSK